MDCAFNLSAVCKSSPTVYAVLQYSDELSLHNSDVTLCLYRCKCKKEKYKKVHISLKCIHCIRQSFLYSFFTLGLHLHTAYHSNLRTTWNDLRSVKIWNVTCWQRKNHYCKNLWESVVEVNRCKGLQMLKICHHIFILLIC